MKQIHPWLRYIFYLGSFLGLLAGIQLYFLSDQTDRYFAWTIQSTLTAATFGALYFGAMTFGLMALRERIWAHVRGPALGLFVFISVTLAATVMHIDRFHFGSESIITRASAWLWMSIYAVLPFAMIVALVLQARLYAPDPRRISSLPAWIRALLVLHAITGIAIAALLFFLPQTLIAIWPWALTPLTARALAAWLVSFSVVDLQAILENDWMRLKIVAYGYLVSGILAILALVRYAGQMDWQSAVGVGYVLYLLAMVSVGLLGFFQIARR